MTRTGVNILLVGLFLAGLGGAAYLVLFFGPVNMEFFETVVLLCWGIGAALVLSGAVVAGFGKVGSRP